MAALAPILAAFDAVTLNKNIDWITALSTRVKIGTTGNQTKSLTPEGVNSLGIARWVYKAGGISLGYPAFTMSMRGPTKSSRINKVSAKFVLPVLEQTSASTASGIQPAPTKAYDLTCLVDFLLPERASAVEKQALLSFVLSMFAAEIADSANANNVATASPLYNAVLSDEHPY